jgi:hypothetical protein
MTHVKGGRWLALVVVLTAGTGRLAAADGDTSSQLPVLIPMGVAGAPGTAQAAVGYVANASGGIDAIRLKDGTLLWSTREASRPLIAYGNRLAALRGNRVVVLDVTQKGKKVFQSAELPLAGGALTPQPGSVLLSVSAWLSRGDLVVKWVGAGYIHGGVTYERPAIEDMIRRARGVVRVGLGPRGFIEKLDPDTMPPPALPEGLRYLNAPVGYPPGRLWYPRPHVAVVGDKVATLVREEGDGKEKLVLQRWDLKTGKAEAPLTLREGRNLFWQMTLDGRHVFLAPPKSSRNGELYSLETGKKVATPPVSLMQPVSVLGSRMYFLTEGPPKGKGHEVRVIKRVLKAMELKTGKVVWERQVEGVHILPPRY